MDGVNLVSSVREVGLGEIGIGEERLRTLRSDTVKQLRDSMGSNGQLQPIVLRPKESGAGYWLVAGHHRLEAARELKWDSIKATIFNGMDADQAELAEIDENYVRAELTPIERFRHAARHKVLYEATHPETRHGGAPGKAGGGKKARDAKSASFVDDMAARTGKAKRTIALDARRGGLDGIAAAIGTTLDKGDEVDTLLELPADRRTALIERARNGERVSAKTESRKYKREQREQDLGAKILALPQNKYGVMLEDYEWDQQTWSEAGKDRHAGNHYPTSHDAHTAEEIVERTKDRLACAADDCVLFMWTTVPHNAIAMDVLRLRGFTYKSQVVWDKEIPGTGYWFRNQHEILLVGTRGNVPAPAPGTQWPSIIREKKREHSRKPEQSYVMIEAYFPHTPKIELNCRGVPRPGWDAWGNETAKESEFRYVRHADVPRFTAEGWQATPALDGTHHGEHAVLMRRIEQG